jgi:hypothetical protein
MQSQAQIPYITTILAHTIKKRGKISYVQIQITITSVTLSTAAQIIKLWQSIFTETQFKTKISKLMYLTVYICNTQQLLMAVLELRHYL